MSFWSGKRVFITGHTGFRGSWLTKTLKSLGAEVFGYSLAPSGKSNLFELENIGADMVSTFADIRDLSSLKSSLDFAQPEIIFHLVGESSLKDSWSKIPEVYSTAIMGTINVLECLRETASTRALVVLSSDKVYRSDSEVKEHKETDALAGNAPAAAAKACVELVIESYLKGIFAPEKYNKHKIAVGSARMAQALGGGDFSSDNLIFQLATARVNGTDVELRNPHSARYWIGIDDAVSALLTLGEALLEKGPKASGAWNFGLSQNDLITNEALKTLFLGNSVFNEGSPRSFHSSLDCSKAFEVLGWKPQQTIEQAVHAAAQWFEHHYKL